MTEKADMSERRDSITSVLVGGAGVALAVVASALPYYHGISYAVFDGLTSSRFPWIFQNPVLLILALDVVATALLAIRPVRGFAAGMLFTAGLGGYLLDTQRLLDFSDHLLVPGYGNVLKILADIVLLIAGLRAASNSVPVLDSPSWLTVMRRIGVIATLCAMVSIFAGNWNAIFNPVHWFWPFSSWWPLGLPLGLSICGLVNAAQLRDRTLRFADGALLAAGSLLSIILGSDYFNAANRYEIVDEAWVKTGLIASLLITATAGAVFARTVWRRSAPASSIPRPERPERPSGEGGEDTAPARTYPEMTRYLCVAAHVDGEFTKQVVQLVINNRRRVPAPSIGIDLDVVLRHCLAAYRRHRRRDVALGLVGIPTVLLLLGFLFGAVADLWPAVLLLLAGWLVTAADEWVGRYRIAARTLSKSGFDPARTPPLSDGDELDAVAAAIGSANVTIYGSYQPFVGSGREQGGWSFALSVLNGKPTLGDGQRLPPMRFELDDLYDAVRRDVEALELDGAMVRVVVEDRLYVDGQGVHEDGRFLPEGRKVPRSVVSDAELRAFVQNPELANRVYRCIRIHGWESEFVLSIYLNFARTGRGLFIQARYFLLLPLKGDYLAVDHLDPRMTTARTLARAGRAAARPGTIGRVLAAPFRLFTDARSQYRYWRSRDAVTDPGFNYGATTSVRELAQAQDYRRYFQQLDRDMIGKIVERQILDSVVAFLDRHNIDTSELEERQTAILNNGLIVSGGTVQADNLAVGSDSRSTVVRIAARLVRADDKAAARRDKTGAAQ